MEHSEESSLRAAGMERTHCLTERRANRPEPLQEVEAEAVAGEGRADYYREGWTAVERGSAEGGLDEGTASSPSSPSWYD
jgi:hypothetical protein